ncbi:MAG: tetratricopeptide repeat protein [Deltaproteobacteria bacterium]|nr:tetratricopeptide repeat protein [Candidatus Zymogenaceae bacterium]
MTISKITEPPHSFCTTDEYAHRMAFFQRSLDYFMKMLEHEPDNPPAWGHAGLLLYELGRTNESIEYFNRIIARDPDNAIAHDAVGFIEMERGRFAEASRHFEASLSGNPGRIDIVFDLALCLMNTHRLEESLRHIESIPEGNRDVRAWFLLGKAENARGLNPLPLYRRGLSVYQAPDGPVREAVYAAKCQMRGIMYHALGDRHQAINAFLEAGTRAARTDQNRMILSGDTLEYLVRNDFIDRTRALASVGA